MTPKLFASRRHVAAVVASAGLFSLVSGPLVAQRATSAVPEHPDAQTVLHVLNRVTFGPRPGDIERVQKMGITAFIDEQLHPDKIDDAAMNERLAGFTTITMSARDLSDQIFQPAQQVRRDEQVKQAKAAQKEAKSAATAGDPSMAMDPNAPKPPQPGQAQISPEARMLQQQQQNVIQELMQAKILRAAYSDRQLEEVLTDFWFNHFNVYAQKGQVRNYLTAYERDVIRPHVLGSFRDLLGATAHSPAMLFYLDNWQSAAANAQPLLTPELQRRLNNPRLPPQQRQQMMQRLDQAKKNMPKGLNENYGRELMELHTLGVDGGYTQKDVQEVARAFTGWTIDRPQQGGDFVFRPQLHDTGEKTILGYHFPSGHGEDEGERVLDILAKSPQTAHHISYELAQRFVADKPPASLVDRTAKVYLDTNGDLRQVVRAILTSPEFYAADAYRAKVKTPLEFVVSAVRATDATVTNAQPIIAELRGNLGMPLYGCQPPTGYSMTADAWVNTGALLERMNFALQLVSNQPGQGRPGGPGRLGGGGGAIPGRPNAPQGGGGRGGAAVGRNVPLRVDITTLAPDTTDASRDHLLDALLAGHVSDSTMRTLAKAQTPQQLIALTLGAPEFQRR